MGLSFLQRSIKYSSHCGLIHGFRRFADSQAGCRRYSDEISTGFQYVLCTPFDVATLFIVYTLYVRFLNIHIDRCVKQGLGCHSVPQNRFYLSLHAFISGSLGYPRHRPHPFRSHERRIEFFPRLRSFRMIGQIMEVIVVQSMRLSYRRSLKKKP